MTKTEPRSAGSGGGRDKTTPTELLACPFCGDPASLSRSGAPVSYVHCLKCITCGPVGRTDAEAVAAWNRRATTLSAREDGWQPIETAPDWPHSHSLRVLGWNAEYGVMFAQYTPGMAHHGSPWMCENFSGSVKPTHWQPLPKAPTAGEGDGR